MDPKRVLIIAGPNGAGKTTFATECLARGADRPDFVNADLIARGLSPLRPAPAAGEAGRLMLQEIHGRARGGRSFAFETTLAGRAALRWIPRWRNAGRQVRLFHLNRLWRRSLVRRLAGWPTRREAPPGRGAERVLPPRERGRNGSRRRFGPPSCGEPRIRPDDGVPHLFEDGFPCGALYPQAVKLASVELAAARVRRRVRQGGHDVPESVIRRRLARGWENFRELYRPIVDPWALYDDSGGEPVLVGRGEGGEAP